MKKTSVSLCVLCFALTFAGPANSALRVGNAGTGRGGTYSAVGSGDYYSQQLAQSQQLQQQLALPVRVADTNMATAISAGQTFNETSMSDLDKCAAIYPNGAFAWDTPTVGLSTRTGCVAEVEMRVDDGAQGIVVARARIPAGGALMCNISEFPPDGYTTEASKVTFPADKEPTIDDVTKVMNQEQKQGAGFKIAAAAILGGLGGNFIGRNESGSTAALGTGKDKMTKALEGAIAMGGTTAIATQSGKVAGDVIQGAAINAVGGALIGNMSGIGKSTLLIRDCKKTDSQGKTTDTGTCLYGSIGKSEEFSKDADGNYKNAGFLGIAKGTIIKCDAARPNTSTGLDEFQNCGVAQFASWSVSGIDQKTKDDDRQRALENNNNVDNFCLTGNVIKQTDSKCGGDEIFVKLTNVQTITNPQAAVIFGWDKKDNTWDKWRTGSWTSFQGSLYFRHNDGTLDANAVPGGDDGYKIANFLPFVQDASSGAIIDFNNQGRAGATATGAGIGAGLGAFSAYQGATTEIEQRWVAAVQDYKDSLLKINCWTGGRLLSGYNETIIIPNVQ